MLVAIDSGDYCRSLVIALEGMPRSGRRNSGKAAQCGLAAPKLLLEKVALYNEPLDGQLKPGRDILQGCLHTLELLGRPSIIKK